MKALKYDTNTFTTRDEARTFLIDNGFVPSSEKTEYGRWVRILDDTDINADTDIERVEAYRNQSGTYTVAKVKPRTANTVYIVE